jgi:hypothetical protein
MPARTNFELNLTLANGSLENELVLYTFTMTPFYTIKYESFFEFKVNDATPTLDSSIPVVLNAALGLLSFSEMRPITNTLLISV